MPEDLSATTAPEQDVHDDDGDPDAINTELGGGLLPGNSDYPREAAEDTPELARLRHDLGWHYDEVARLRTVMRQALNTLTNPRWPGDPDPQVAVMQLLAAALKPNSTVGRLE